MDGYPDILTLIPQRAPMLCVDSLLSFQGPLCETAFRISGEHIFVRDGVLQEAGLVENMAQSCAARIGYVSVVLRGEVSPRLGVIGAVKSLVISDLPKAGKVLHTKVALQTEFGDMSVTDCKVFCEEREVASAQFVISLV